MVTTRSNLTQLESLREEIEALCSLGLPFDSLLPPLLDRIRELIPSEFVTCIWTPVGKTELTAFSQKTDDAELIHRYLVEFVNKRENELVTPFSEFIVSGRKVEDLSWFEGIEKSDLYNEVLRPIRSTRAIRARVGLGASSGIGTLTLSRSERERPFTGDEIRLLESLTGFLDNAVRNDPSLLGYGEVSNRGILIARPDGEIVSSSGQAEATLLMANGVGLVRSSEPGRKAARERGERLLPAAVRSAIAKSIKGGKVSQIPIQNHWGHFAFTLHPLSAAGGRPGAPSELAIVVEHREDRRLERFRAAREKGLSPQEALVVTEFLNGSSHEETARQLRIAQAVLEEHLARIYSKLGINDRYGLAQLISPSGVAAS